MLNWAKRFNIFCYLDNQQFQQEQQFECVLAVQPKRFIDDTSSFYSINDFVEANNTWCFGHLSYDLKNVLHQLKHRVETNIHFPLYYFFEPEHLIFIRGNTLEIHSPNSEEILEQVLETHVNNRERIKAVELQQRFTKDEYKSVVAQLQQHILKGDCYEINFCQEFFADDTQIDPFAVFSRLLAVSPTPYSALYRLHDKFLICASPERYIRKAGRKVFSQPMKGTAPRDTANAENDRKLKEQLQHSSKERAENIMVVDLVRNDLSKICQEATVTVEELCGVYSFAQVHQMISTVKGLLKDKISFAEIIEATFPMGSMTGAPKHRVMQLVEQYEKTPRGLFSGSVGYIDDTKNFDFNVVIRSILVNTASEYLSFSVGSGITFYSDAEKEWEECLLKAAAIKKVLTL